MDEIESAKTFMNQLAKKNLVKSIKDWNINDSKWYLERRQKNRYSLRQELETESKIDFHLSNSDINNMSLDELKKVLLKSWSKFFN